ncbi:FAD-dependent monooxygenase [Pyxidicoccus fallax]|nr:FAD-dependent monooxygenase [Pyxidicoccus fallax]
MTSSRRAAIVVGASLSGLMTGLALSRAGLDVTLLERAGTFPRTGAAIGLDAGVLRRLARLTGSTSFSLAPSPTSLQGATWSELHARLRASAESDPHIVLHHEAPVQRVDQDADAVWAATSDGRTFRGDILVGADGHRSIVRRQVSPEKPDATFAGYLIWLGLADEAALPAPRRWPQDVVMLSGADDFMFGYPVPGRDGSLVPGSRQIGWAWYDAGRNDLLRATGCVVGDVVHRSLAPAHIPAATLRELEEEARERWPSPWRDAIVDCLRRRALIGTPIAEYVPDRLVHERLVLVGDAAHVPSPMTGKGFAASLDDAEALAASLAAAAGSASVPDALRAYERKRLESVRRMVQSGQQFSRGFSREAA